MNRRLATLQRLYFRPIAIDADDLLSNFRKAG
jgi:hypothetical protein